MLSIFHEILNFYLQYHREILGVLVSAVGNRQWGAGPMLTDKIRWPLWIYSKYLSVFTMSLGIFIVSPQLLTYWWSLLIPLLVFGFRAPGTGESWLAAEAGRNLRNAVLRGMLGVILGVFMALLDHHYIHIFFSLMFPFIAFMYIWTKSTEEGELAGGAYLGFISW